jgi:hypothetical protein
MKNLYILPTDKPSSLYYKDDNYKLANSTIAIDWYISSAGYKPTNIYITSDEEIKESDWVFNFEYDYIVQYDSKKHDDKFWYKKIILTTDQDLIADGVQAIDDEFLEWFVKNPSCEGVEVEEVYPLTCCIQKEGKTKMNNGCMERNRCLNYKIIIPQEEPKQENCCPKCGELENFHYNYDYSKVEKVHILDILCNECGELFPPILKLPKQKVMKTAMQELIDWATSLQYNQQQCIDWITIKNKAEQLLEKEEPKQEVPEKTKGLVYWKANAEEDYVKVPISVLRYIAELEAKMYSEAIEFAKWQEERIPSIIEEYLETAFISKEQGYMNPKEWFEKYKKNQDE